MCIFQLNEIVSLYAKTIDRLASSPPPADRPAPTTPRHPDAPEHHHPPAAPDRRRGWYCPYGCPRLHVHERTDTDPEWYRRVATCETCERIFQLQQAQCAHCALTIDECVHRGCPPGTGTEEGELEGTPTAALRRQPDDHEAEHELSETEAKEPMDMETEPAGQTHDRTPHVPEARSIACKVEWDCPEGKKKGQPHTIWGPRCAGPGRAPTVWCPGCKSTKRMTNVICQRCQLQWRSCRCAPLEGPPNPPEHYAGLDSNSCHPAAEAGESETDAGHALLRRPADDAGKHPPETPGRSGALARRGSVAPGGEGGLQCAWRSDLPDQDPAGDGDSERLHASKAATTTGEGTLVARPHNQTTLQTPERRSATDRTEWECPDGEKRGQPHTLWGPRCTGPGRALTAW